MTILILSFSIGARHWHCTTKLRFTKFYPTSKSQPLPYFTFLIRKNDFVYGLDAFCMEKKGEEKEGRENIYNIVYFYGVLRVCCVCSV